MIPLYGFLEGDTIGLLVLANEEDTMSQLADRLQQSSRVRVARLPKITLLHKGRALDPDATVAQVGLTPLERFDVVRDVG